jgi:hypothetical protein
MTNLVLLQGKRTIKASGTFAGNSRLFSSAAGRPDSPTTLFRLSVMFKTDLAKLLSGLPRIPKPKER